MPAPYSSAVLGVLLQTHFIKEKEEKKCGDYRFDDCLSFSVLLQRTYVDRFVFDGSFDFGSTQSTIHHYCSSTPSR